MEALTISGWWDEMECAASRKRKKIDWFQCPANCASNGYRELAERGEEGMLAFGVYQALCQALAGSSIEARKLGQFIRSSGDALSLEKVARLIAISPELLSRAIDLLSSSEVGWISWRSVGSLYLPRSATDLPRSATDLPRSATDLPRSAADLPRSATHIHTDSTNRQTDSARGASESSPSSSSPSSDQDLRSEIDSVDRLRGRINQMLGRPETDPWNYVQLSALHEYLAWGSELWDVVERFYQAPAPGIDDRGNPLCLRRKNLTNFLQNLPDELGKAREWEAKQPIAKQPKPAPVANWRDYLEPAGLEVPEWAEWADLDPDFKLAIQTEIQKTKKETAA